MHAPFRFFQRILKSIKERLAGALVQLLGEKRKCNRKELPDYFYARALSADVEVLILLLRLLGYSIQPPPKYQWILRFNKHSFFAKISTNCWTIKFQRFSELKIVSYGFYLINKAFWHKATLHKVYCAPLCDIDGRFNVCRGSIDHLEGLEVEIRTPASTGSGFNLHLKYKFWFVV